MPDVVGMRALEAVKTLRDANLKFSIVFTTTTEGFLKVTSQDPVAGKQVDPGTSVKISIGLPGFLLGGGGGQPSTPATQTPTTTPPPSEPSSPSGSSAETP